jgi:hypothetical protein
MRIHSHQVYITRASYASRNRGQLSSRHQRKHLTKHGSWQVRFLMALTKALNHLLDRGPLIETSNDSELRPTTGNTELSLDMREFGAFSTRMNSTQGASMSTADVTSAEATSDISHRGSFGRLSSVFRADRGTRSTVKGKAPSHSIYEASMVTNTSRHSVDHIHNTDEGVENVRACCGGI